MTQTREEINDRIDLFVETLQDFYTEDFNRKYPMLEPSRIEIDGGVKYQRISVITRHKNTAGVVTDGQRSVYCFIDLSNGDILKAAGWKAPAKGARGNIFNDNCDVGTRADMHGSGLYIR
jgi:hypothetical protein